MKRYIARLGVVLIAVMLLVCACAGAEGSISTTVLMRVSKMTQNAVVNEGEDFTIEVNIDGAEPAAYQWYFNDAPIDGATQKVYNIIHARPEDAGVYRLDAFDADGAMLLSMDVSARVRVDEVPQAGDASLPIGIAFAALAACGATLAALIRRRGMA